MRILTVAEGPLELIALPPVGWLVAAVWGALWGSFFNVCIHRIGLYESVAHPPSRCPGCGRAIRAFDNIPVLSWLALGGRCRNCRRPISVRYPLIEALSSLLALAVYARFVAGETDDVLVLVARFFVYFAFVGTLLVLSGIDFDHYLIPDRITYPAIPLFLLAAVLLRDIAPLDAIGGAILGYAIVAVVAELFFVILKREAMGYGDAKLLALVGAVLGWRGVLYTFFLAPYLGLAAVVPRMLVQRKKLLGVEIPYGPWLALAALLDLLFGRSFAPVMSRLIGRLLRLDG